MLLIIIESNGMLVKLGNNFTPVLFKRLGKYLITHTNLSLHSRTSATSLPGTGTRLISQTPAALISDIRPFLGFGVVFVNWLTFPKNHDR